MSKQRLIHLSFCLVLCLAAMMASSSAEADFCGTQVETIYYAWVDNNDPNAYWCSVEGPLCGPCGQPIDEYADWVPIGGTYRDCDGETSSWGNTLCTEPHNTERHFQRCDC